MNYIKVHDEMIKHFKNTTPRDRLYNRNKEDYRLKADKLYIEIHHILPKSQNGDNSKQNLVELLPEEHLFIHHLRYKAFDTREDMLAFRFILNGLQNNGKYDKITKNKTITKKVLKAVAILKHESAAFRNKHGWQTEDGRRRISEARKGTFPAKDRDGNPVGAVPNNHPKVLSGEWVHHSTGFTSVIEISTGEVVRLSSKEYQENKEKYKNLMNYKGMRNPRAYKDITAELILSHFEEYINTFEEEERVAYSWPHMKRWLKLEKDITIPSTSKSRFENFHQTIYEKFGIKRDTSYRTKYRCKNISKGRKHVEN